MLQQNMSTENNRRSYQVYVISTSIISLAAGIFGPFFILFINQRGGGYEAFGMILGVTVLVQSVAAYYGGKHSDQIGRRPYLIGRGYLQAVVVLLYLGVTHIWQLYVLGAVDGALFGIQATVGNAFIADLTTHATRGKDIGKRDALMGVCAGTTMMLGGYFVTHFGILTIFILMAAAEVIAASLLFLTEE